MFTNRYNTYTSITPSHGPHHRAVRNVDVAGDDSSSSDVVIEADGASQSNDGDVAVQGYAVVVRVGDEPRAVDDHATAVGVGGSKTRSPPCWWVSTARLWFLLIRSSGTLYF